MTDLDVLHSMVDRVEQLEGKLRRQMGKDVCRFCGEELTEDEQYWWGDQCHNCTEDYAN